MAIYHCSVKIIGRSGGRSAVSAAAYRSGEKLVNQETGITVDFTRKSGVVYSEIDLPENAPEEYKDRETLWNAVEKIESRANAQLAREVEVALPKEFSREVQIDVLREYINENFVSKGMIADWSIHVPNKNTENPHAHIMLTTRSFKENGDWDAKKKETYKLDENGEKIPVIDPETGQQKIGTRNRKIWERETVPVTNWNDRERMEEWRSGWADACNNRLVAMELDPIDNRSFERQGLDIEPTVHEGYVARQMEARGVMADRCEMNREILERRSLIKDVVNKIRDVVTELKEAVLERLERIGERFERNDRHDFNFGEDRESRIVADETGRDDRATKEGISAEGHADINAFLAKLEAAESVAAKERKNRSLKVERGDLEGDLLERSGHTEALEKGGVYRGDEQIDRGV